MELLEKYRPDSYKPELRHSTTDLPEVTIERDLDEQLPLSKSDWSVNNYRCKSLSSSPEVKSLATSVETLSLSSRASSPEPETVKSARKKNAKRLQRLKDDVAVLSRRIRKSKGDIRGSIENLFKSSRRSGPCAACIAKLQSRSRTIRVEYADDRPSPRGSRGRVFDDDIYLLDQPDHNFTSHLLLTGLENGRFRAEIPLQDLSAEDLLLRIRGYELEIIVNISCCEKCEKKNRLAVPYHIGIIDLPIFVEPKSLQFGHDAERNVILLDGDAKGCFVRRRSASFGSGVQLLKNEGAPSSRRRSSMGEKWKKLLWKIGPRKACVSEENILDHWKTLAKKS